MSNVITINRNKTAIAPTYTIKKTNAKNSTFNKSNKILPKKNTKIRSNIEWIGLTIPITKVAHVKQQQHKKKKKNSIILKSG